MKVIFPFTERVSLLMSHTDYKPTSPMRCKGRPILAHLLQPLCHLPVSEFIFISESQIDEIRYYMDTNYNGLSVSFIHQTEREKGLGYTVSLASDRISYEPVLIVEPNAILNLNWTAFTQNQFSTITIRRIVDEKPYGLVELREGAVGCLIQNPRRTDLALAGSYFIRESKLLFKCLHALIQDRWKRNGEYQLTNAIQRMIEYGVEIHVQEVELGCQQGPCELSNLIPTDFQVFDRL